MLGLDPRAWSVEKTIAWLESDGVTRALKCAKENGLWQKITTDIENAEPTEKQTVHWEEYRHAHNGHNERD